MRVKLESARRAVGKEYSRQRRAAPGRRVPSAGCKAAEGAAGCRAQRAQVRRPRAVRSGWKGPQGLRPDFGFYPGLRAELTAGLGGEESAPDLTLGREAACRVGRRAQGRRRAWWVPVAVSSVAAAWCPDGAVRMEVTRSGWILDIF